MRQLSRSNTREGMWEFVGGDVVDGWIDGWIDVERGRSGIRER